jgi:aspartyl-tRNA synthetase
MFKYLGFTEEEAKAQFGFLMDAFQLVRHLTEV